DVCSSDLSVYTLHVIPNTNFLAVGMRSGEIYIVDTVQQTLQAKLKVDSGAVFSVKSLPAKQELIAVGEEGRAYIWSLGNFELLYTFKISDTTVRVIAMDEDAQYLEFGVKSGVVYSSKKEDYHSVAI